MNRRRAALATGVAGLAGAAAGAAWWHFGRAPQEAPPGFWQLRFDQPGGGELALAPLEGKPLLVNFWATWCAPCIRELPLLDAFAKAQQPAGWTVVGLAIDGPTPVREFLARRPIAFPVGLAGMTGTALGRSLGNAEGGLPFSVLFGRDARIAARKLGALHAEDLQDWSKLA